jgi:hypothetical protein
MSTQSYGLTEWENVEIKSGQNRRDQFLRLQGGSNIVRVLTKPHEYLMHRYKVNENDAGFGEKVMSSLAHGRDALVDKGMKPKKRWLVGVIDRKTQGYKILDMSVSVFKSVQELVKDDDWGDPSQYDIDIKVDKNGGATGYYTVMPKQPKPLSAADLEIKSQVDLDDLKRRCTPPTPEEMEERIRQIHARSEEGNATSSDQNNNNNDDDDDLDFPAVEGSDAT